MDLNVVRLQPPLYQFRHRSKVVSTKARLKTLASKVLSQARHRKKHVSSESDGGTTLSPSPTQPIGQGNTNVSDLLGEDGYVTTSGISEHMSLDSRSCSVTLPEAEQSPRLIRHPSKHSRPLFSTSCEVRHRSRALTNKACLEPPTVKVLSLDRHRKQHFSGSGTTLSPSPTPSFMPLAQGTTNITVPGLLGEDGYVTTSGISDQISLASRSDLSIASDEGCSSLLGVEVDDVHGPGLARQANKRSSVSSSSSENDQCSSVDSLWKLQVTSNAVCEQLQDLVQQVDSAEMNLEEFFSRIKELVDLVAMDEYTSIDNSNYHCYEHVPRAENNAAEDMYLEMFPASNSNSTKNSEVNRKISPPYLVPISQSSLVASQEYFRSTPNLLFDDSKGSMTNAERSVSSKHLMDSDGYAVVKHARSALNISGKFVPSVSPAAPVLPPRRKKSSVDGRRPSSIPHPSIQKPAGSLTLEHPVQPCSRFADGSWKGSLTLPRIHINPEDSLSEEGVLTRGPARNARNLSLPASSSSCCEYDQCSSVDGLWKPFRVTSDEFCVQVQDLVQQVGSTEMSHEEFFTRVRELVDVVDDFTYIDNADYHCYERVSQMHNKVGKDIYIKDFSSNSSSPNSSVVNETVNSHRSYLRVVANQEYFRSTPNLLADDNNESYNAERSISSKHHMDSDGYEIVKHARSAVDISRECVPSLLTAAPVLPPRSKHTSLDIARSGSMLLSLYHKPEEDLTPEVPVRSYTTSTCEGNWRNCLPHLEPNYI